MVSLSVLALLLTLQLSSGSPLVHHDFIIPRQARTNETSVSGFVNTLSLDGSGADALLKSLETNQDVKALIAGKQYDKSSLAHLSCEILKKTAGEEVVASNAIEQVIQKSWLVDYVPPQRTVTNSHWVNRSESCWLIPTCIIRPRTAKDVSKALSVVGFLRTKFAVRSGGHSPNPGFSTLSDPGVMIDLQDLNHITVNDDRSIATVEPGSEWLHVYEALDKYGVSVIGGRGPTVGAGGFMLGGWYPHQPPP
jgi:hypothetical protein